MKVPGLPALFDLTFLIAVPLPAPPAPFPDFPPELLRIIFEFAASADPRTARAAQLVSRPVRRWTHPILHETVEIFGLRRMIAFADVFAPAAPPLLATSVRNLTLYDDTTGDFVPLDILVDPALLRRILLLCRGVRRLALSYIRGIPHIDGPLPHELTVRRGLRGIRLNRAPFAAVTHLHCRYEQLLRSGLARLDTTRLTHVCFTHNLDFGDDECRAAVTALLQAPRIQLLIVEVAFHKWHPFEDPSVRRVLAADVPDQRLFMRLSRYDTVMPYDRQPVFSHASSSRKSIWNVDSDRDWRDRPWEKETILRVFRTVQDRTFRDLLSLGSS